MVVVNANGSCVSVSDHRRPEIATSPMWSLVDVGVVMIDNTIIILVVLLLLLLLLLVVVVVVVEVATVNKEGQRNR